MHPSFYHSTYYYVVMHRNIHARRTFRPLQRHTKWEYCFLCWSVVRCNITSLHTHTHTHTIITRLSNVSFDATLTEKLAYFALRRSIVRYYITSFHTKMAAPVMSAKNIAPYDASAKHEYCVLRRFIVRRSITSVRVQITHASRSSNFSSVTTAFANRESLYSSSIYRSL